MKLTIKTADDLQAEKDEAERVRHIAELKKLLTDSDYKVLPEYDKTDDTIVQQRQEWRETIRTLEANND